MAEGHTRAGACDLGAPPNYPIAFPVPQLVPEVIDMSGNTLVAAPAALWKGK